MRVRSAFVLLCALLVLCGSASFAQGSGETRRAKDGSTGAPGEIPLATASRVERAKDSWWPTKKAESREEFLGYHACASCHAQKTASQLTTPMAHAASAASSARILREHPVMSEKRGPFTYAISGASGGYRYSVSDGTGEVAAAILWAFGNANKGQTYLYEKDGEYYESEMSFYAAIGGLDVTTGHEQRRPETVADALGMAQDRPSAEKCFGCHTTGATTVSGGFVPQNATPGVTCEACHGPGGAHAALMQQLQAEGVVPSGNLRILNPHSLSPIATVDFCGACHRTWADVYEMQAGATGPVNARFQPYQLENSRCWGEGDSRLVCTACHDPHEPLQHDDVAYDAKCLACHAIAKSKKTTTVRGAIVAASDASHTPRVAKACPVATSRCVSCHMPKINVPVMHSDFTDHRIRVVRKGEPYPD